MKLDPGDIYNHPWLLGLRGEMDFARFLDKIQARPADFSMTAMLESTVTEWADDVDVFALDRLSEVYLNFVPTYHGVFTPLRQKDEYPPSMDLVKIIYNGNEDKKRFNYIKEVNALQKVIGPELKSQDK
jgi:hypothetical protein